MGGYVQGQDLDLDQAIQLWPSITEFLQNDEENVILINQLKPKDFSGEQIDEKIKQNKFITNKEKLNQRKTISHLESLNAEADKCEKVSKELEELQRKKILKSTKHLLITS